MLLVGRERTSLSNTRLGRSLESVPVVIRFGIAVVINYFVATFVLTTVWRTAQGLRPVLFSVVIGLVVFWLLMPGPTVAKSGPSDVLEQQI